GSAIEGFLLGAGLIIAIGAQNAFVLRQGLAGRHVFAVATLCAASDISLIAAGVAGLGGLGRGAPIPLSRSTLARGLSLAAYGAMAFGRARKPRRLPPAATGEARLSIALATTLVFTFLNPHVYLDTVVLIGAVSSRHQGRAALAFGAGAGLASIVWF